MEQYLPATVASWTQDAACTGTVTVATVYPGKGAFTNLTITGDCTIMGGAWTHPVNATTGSNRYNLAVLPLNGEWVYSYEAMSNSVHTRPTLDPADARKETLALWERNRLRCGWFLRDDFTPRTRDDFVRCLGMLAQHGDRATYVLTRRLLRCL